MRRRDLIGWAVASTITAGVLMGASSRSRTSTFAQTRAQGSGASTMLACNPDSPIVSGGQVVLQAWPSPEIAAPQLSWTAASGRIQTNTSEARWDLRGLPPAAYTATASLRDSRGTVTTCEVRVVLPVGEETRDPRLTARTLLLPGQNEAGGYGLYSYLLFGSPPAKSEEALYLNTVAAYLELIGDLDAMSAYLPAAEMNVTYVPVQSAPTADVLAVLLKKQQATAKAAQWILDNYDYPRAQITLRRMTGSFGEGPYFVSSKSALVAGAATETAYLIQDLSNRQRPEFARSWVKVYLNQVAQERFWEPRTLETSGLKMRYALANLAPAFKETIGPLETVIRLIGLKK